jgi:hypothetical protein
MRIVNENPDADLARERATRQVDWTLRDLTANLMRVTRGAGKPYEIGRQAQDFIAALIDYRDAVGHFPPSAELASLLTVERDPEVMARMNDDNLAQIYAEQEIIRGSLQIVASRLVGQSKQETAGSHEMLGGVNSLIAARAERQKKWATAKPVAQRKTNQAVLKSPRNKVRKPEA